MIPELVNYSDRHLDQEEAADKMIEVDGDGDGHVTWNEYLHKTYSYTPEDVVKMAADKSDEVQTFYRVPYD